MSRGLGTSTSRNRRARSVGRPRPRRFDQQFVVPAARGAQVDLGRLWHAGLTEPRNDAFGQARPEERTREREPPGADGGHALVDGQPGEALQFVVRQAGGDQVNVIDPDQAFGVAMVHHRVDAREEQRVHRTDGPGMRRRARGPVRRRRLTRHRSGCRQTSTVC